MLADESDVKKPKLHHNMEQVTHQSAADGSWHVFPPVAKDNANGGTSQMGGSSRGISPGDNDGKSETSDFEKDFEDELFEELQACMEHSTPRVEDTSLPANAASEPDRLTSLPAELLARVLSWLPHTWLLGPARRISKVLTAVADAQAARLTQTKLKEALEAGFASDGRDVVPAQITVLTISVQQELSSAPRETFRGKYRALLFNLKDAKNPDLRHRLLEGTLCARELLRLSPREMAAEALQQQRSEWRQKRTRERIRPDWRECGGFTTTLFRCERCGGTESKVHQAIRAGRMAVDRARTYATCTSCRERWEV